MHKVARSYAAVRTLVYVQWCGAAVLSFMHIVTVGQRFGLGWQSWTAPFLIDGFALLGAVGRGKAFTASSRKAGFILMVGSGAVSLACNVEAGTNIGQRVFGVLVVAGFITAEWFANRLRPARKPAPRKPRSAPVSPGLPPVELEPAESLAYREAVVEFKRESALAALNAR
jgi:hypothetical protein